MKFDFVIGNPPYQEESVGNQKTFAPPVYYLFLDEAYKISEHVEMIHPARFLYNAGGTPKSWNEKMLADPHLKILQHEQNSSLIFENTNINGGIAITYHDISKNFGAIGVYSRFAELNTIRAKVWKTEKITQDNTAIKWKYVPLQDFTPNSDIDWSQPIPQIDQQLYKKYGLDQSEVNFIETYVKEMA